MFDRAKALDFSLTSNGIALTGHTTSGRELLSFIDRLAALADLLPDSDSDQSPEGIETSGSTEGASAGLKGIAQPTSGVSHAS